MYFSKMCYDVYYHLVKFQLKTPTMHGEMKNIVKLKSFLKKESHNKKSDILHKFLNKTSGQT